MESQPTASAALLEGSQNPILLRAERPGTKSLAEDISCGSKWPAAYLCGCGMSKKSNAKQNGKECVQPCARTCQWIGVRLRKLFSITIPGYCPEDNLQRRALPLSSNIPPRLRRWKSKVQFSRNLAYIFDIFRSFPQEKLILASGLVLLQYFNIVHAKAGVD